MPKKTSTRQKAGRTLQEQNVKPGHIGKRAVNTPRVQQKQRGGKASRRRAGR